MYSNPYKGKTTTATIYDEYAGIMNEFLGGNKMNKIVFDDGKEVELSKETTERLRKELVKPPYQFKAGDVAKHPSTWIDDPFRIIVYVDGKLKSYNRKGQVASIGQERFELERYKKIGELKDFIKEFTN